MLVTIEPTTNRQPSSRLKSPKKRRSFFETGVFVEGSDTRTVGFW
jgi:hypothetical protein